MTIAQHKIRPLEAKVLALLFALAICAPVAKQYLIGEPDTSFFEGRRMEQLPRFEGGWKWVAKTAPAQYNSYFNDHVGFRAALMQANAMIRLHSFQTSAAAAAIGTDGWFFKVENLKDSSTPFTEAQLENWKRYLETRQKWLAERGIKYLVIVPPDKETIYPEHLPAENRPPQDMPIDQIIAYLKKTNSPVQILSLRDALLAGKTKEHQRLYYTLDDHWNSLGGFYGYEAVIRRLAEWYPDMKPKKRFDFGMTIGIEEIPGTGKALGPVTRPLFASAAQKTPFSLPGLPNDGSLPLPFTTESNLPGHLPRVVVLRDSFTYALAPYLSENFNHITYWWPVLHPSKNNLKIEKILASLVAQEKPDVFIEERIQRFFSVTPDVSIVFGGDGTAGIEAKNPPTDSTANPEKH